MSMLTRTTRLLLVLCTLACAAAAGCGDDSSTASTADASAVRSGDAGGDTHAAVDAGPGGAKARDAGGTDERDAGDMIDAGDASDAARHDGGADQSGAGQGGAGQGGAGQDGAGQGGSGGSIVPPQDTDADDDGYADDVDCDDGNAAVHPGADERCNGSDDDCDGSSDEDAVDATVFYRDADDDGYGSGASMMEACAPPSGYVAAFGDCDDSDSATHPGATEVCNVFDDDCDGHTDEGASDQRTWYADGDADGFGDPNTTIATCDVTAPPGYSDVGTDCDDASSNVNPSVSELCSTVGIDDDCNGHSDESTATDAPTWYRDVDGDTWGGTTTARACSNPSTNTEAWAERGGDCDDATGATHPSATDLPDDAHTDSNCDGMDGDAARAVFVAGSAAGCGCSDGNLGTRNVPYCTLSAAIDAAAPSSRNTVIIANDVYPVTQTIVLHSGVHLVGGYVCNTLSGGVRQWIRSTPSAVTLRGAANLAGGVTMLADGAVGATNRITAPTRLDGLTIDGPDMGATPSSASIGLRVRSVASSLLVLRNVRIEGGQGGHGTPGSNGALLSCDVAGGDGGNHDGCGSDGGGNGSSAGPGNGGPGSGGGAGTSTCNEITCGTTGTVGITNGGNGTNGGSANNGTGGSAGAALYGMFDLPSGNWTASNPTSGTNGTHGGGGGGGGEGGSRYQTACINCSGTREGGPGGKGGRGGCGGGTGQGGTSGGASIALELVNAALVTAEANVSIRRGDGGNGGKGGDGANGESGPAGMLGTAQSHWECSAGIYYYNGAGGNGGAGGDGGGGGGGGGGHGGASWGIVTVGAGNGVTNPVSFISGGSGGTLGAGGAGGHKGVTGTQAPSGTNGTAGLSENTHAF